LSKSKPDFSTYPKPVRGRLLALRKMIFDVGERTPGVGELEESLRWGNPAILRRKQAAAAPSGLIISEMSQINAPCILYALPG
jgi:hypothetical protein